MAADLADFLTTNEEDLDAALETYGYTREQAAMDFWLTRNGHGAGFWDHDLGAIGQRLTANAKAYGEAYLYLGRFGHIYHS
jgi:hypothetical protein